MWRSRRIFVRAALALVCGATLAFASGGVNAEPKRGGILKSFTSGYRTLNPGVQSGSATGIPGTQLFAGLVLTDKSFKPKPYLAKDWTISADGLTYTFHLVDGAVFHDGTPITSADVAFSLDVVKNNHPFGSSMFGNVTAVDTPDPHTAVIRLSKPTPGLMLSLEPVLLPIMPKHIYGDGQNLKTHPRNMQGLVGSGPFVLTENKPGERLVLSRFDKFFIKGKPYLDQITFQVVKDPLTRMLMLEKGELDLAGVSGMRPQDADRLSKEKGVHVTTKGYEAIGYVHYLEMNLRRKPFDDIRVRRALAHAIDSNFLAKVLFRGRTKAGTGPLHMGNPFYSPDVPNYKADLKLAEKLLDEAGLKKGPDGTRFAFTLDVPNWAIQTDGPVADYLRPQLAKIGIKVELRRAPDFGTWSKRISSFDYDATLNGSYNYPDPTIGVHRHFLCANIRNVVWANTEGYCNKDVDAILDKAASEMDFAKRKMLYADLQKKIVEDLVFIYLPQEYVTTVYRDTVKNPPLGAYGPMAPWFDVYLGK